MRTLGFKHVHLNERLFHVFRVRHDRNQNKIDISRNPCIKLRAVSGAINNAQSVRVDSRVDKRLEGFRFPCVVIHVRPAVHLQRLAIVGVHKMGGNVIPGRTKSERVRKRGFPATTFPLCQSHASHDPALS